MLDHLFTNLWEGLISRTSGPLKFRFLLQPSMAIFLAVRSGLKESWYFMSRSSASALAGPFLRVTT